MKFANEVLEYHSAVINRKLNLKLDDAYCLNLLQPVINNYPFLPFTGSSLRPFCLAHILNDILVNQRQHIIEFGSGISTILIGRLIQKNNLKAEVLSVEHEKNWADELDSIIRSEQLDQFITILHAPLTKCALHPQNSQWYDLKILKSRIEKKKFDMVIVDGPPAWQEGKELARYPAFPFIKNNLSEKYSVYLDDANRNGEQMVLQMWQKKYGIKFSITGHTLAFYYHGHSFYTEPFVYYE